MNAKKRLVDHRRERHCVEYAAEVLPELNAEFPPALVRESENGRHFKGFVVAADHVDVFWIADLQGKQKANDFHRLWPPINVIPKEQPRREGRQAARIKGTKEVEQLPVDIAADVHRSPDFEERRLGQEKGSDGLAKPLGVDSGEPKIGTSLVQAVVKNRIEPRPSGNHNDRGSNV
jgi:hypothetical protein